MTTPRKFLEVSPKGDVEPEALKLFGESLMVLHTHLMALREFGPVHALTHAQDLEASLAGVCGMAETIFGKELIETGRQSLMVRRSVESKKLGVDDYKDLPKHMTEQNAQDAITGHHRAVALFLIARLRAENPANGAMLDELEKMARPADEP